MTTDRDCGSKAEPQMLRCELRASNLYPTLVLALRDMRDANQRNPTTGTGDGNRSWIGLSIGMIVLDTLTGGETQNTVGKRWRSLLTSHGVTSEDANIIYGLRCSLLHGYGPPRPEAAAGRNVLLSPDPTTFAVDTRQAGWAVVSVPVFCKYLVERIATEANSNWDTSLIDTNIRL